MDVLTPPSLTQLPSSTKALKKRSNTPLTISLIINANIIFYMHLLYLVECPLGYITEHSLTYIHNVIRMYNNCTGTFLLNRIELLHKLNLYFMRRKYSVRSRGVYCQMNIKKILKSMTRRFTSTFLDLPKRCPVFCK